MSDSGSYCLIFLAILLSVIALLSPDGPTLEDFLHACSDMNGTASQHGELWLCLDDQSKILAEWSD